MLSNIVYFVFTFRLFRFYFIFIRDRRPLSARGSNNSDSIEDYIRNWKKNDSGTSPLHSPGIESVKWVYVLFLFHFIFVYFILFCLRFVFGLRAAKNSLLIPWFMSWCCNHYEKNQFGVVGSCQAALKWPSEGPQP